jgi:uncharacterized membrane protein YhhN
MNALNLLPFAATLLTVLLVSEYKGARTAALVTKTGVSLLFVAAALLQPGPMDPFAWVMVGGLCFCLGGDVLLALPGERPFLAGLVSFLLGHVWYVVAFFGLASPGPLAWGGAVAVLVIAALVFAWLAPHLGNMKIPVIAYMLVISVMVVGALSVMGDASYPAQGRTFVLVGAVGFFVSDIFVARDRFVARRFENRLAGLPLYYVAQFLLAFSIGLL